MSTLTQPLKWHGGKHDLAAWILSHAPPRCLNPNKPDPADPGYLHYVEPYFGGGSVLLANDPEGISEVVNDISSELINFWITLRERRCFERFQRAVEAAPFSEALWEAACHNRKPDGFVFSTDDSRADAAYWFFIRCRQSMSGRMKNFPPMVKTRCRRGMQDHVSAWLNSVEGLPEVHARIKRVVILNRGALEIIRTQDGPRTWFYLDPPYLHETRATTGEYGENEMTVEQHADLLATLAYIRGRFALSGYHSTLYDDFAELSAWRCVEKQINNHAAGGKTKRRMTECLWMNY